MSVPTRMHPADLAALADLVAARVVAELGERREPPPGALLTAGQVAQRFGVDRSYVYAHADVLGAVRLGDGPKARLRFDPERVAERLAAKAATPPQAPEPPRRRSRRTARTGTDLLPIGPQHKNDRPRVATTKGTP